MKSAFRSLQIFLLLCGVFGADELKSVSVIEGDSVTLNPDLTQIKKFSLLEWKFGDSVIARTDGKDISYPSPTEIFRDRLQLDETGSLTIKNMKARLSGLYELQISHSARTSESKFNVTVQESPSIAGKAEVKSLSVTEGAPVTLQTDVTQLYGDELIVWRCGDKGRLIAKADMEAKSSPLYYDERFRGRLELDQTGSLTIKNTRTTDSGFYTVKISSKKQTSYQRFSVAVIDGTDEVMSVSVMEGDSISLNTGVTEVQNYHLIQWMFGETRIAEINNLIKSRSINGTDDDETLKNRLNLDPQTGSLTITHTRTTDSGLYQLILTSGETRSKSFRVTVSVTWRSWQKLDNSKELTLKRHLMLLSKKWCKNGDV